MIFDRNFHYQKLKIKSDDKKYYDCLKDKNQILTNKVKVYKKILGPTEGILDMWWNTIGICKRKICDIYTWKTQWTSEFCQKQWENYKKFAKQILTISKNGIGILIRFLTEIFNIKYWKWNSYWQYCGIEKILRKNSIE